MKSKKIIVLIGLFVIGFALGLTSYLLNDNGSGSKELELTYHTNSGVPYEWRYEIEDKSIAKFVKKYTLNEEKNVDSGKIDINYVFKGLKKGKTNITFKYVNVINGEVKKEEKITVKVDNHKNISLIVYLNK